MRDPARHVTPLQWFTDQKEMFPIHNINDAVSGIDVIIDQGERTIKDPFDEDDNPVHYYRIEHIVQGKSWSRFRASNLPISTAV